MERSLSKKSRVLAEYVRKKGSLPTSYFGPDNNTLSSLPDYGVSNAALPRGENPSVHPDKQLTINPKTTKETIMSNKQELAKIAKEIKQIKASLNKQSGYDWSYIKNQSQKVDWYDVQEDGEELQLGYYGPGGGDYPDVSAHIYLGNRYDPNGFYVEVMLNEYIGEKYPDLAKKLTKAGVAFDSQWGVNFEADIEKNLLRTLWKLADILENNL